MKAQPKIYHATDVKFDEFDPSINMEDPGTWFSLEKPTAEDIKEFPIVKIRVLKKDVKLIKESEFSKLEHTDEYLESDLDVDKFLLKKGFRGIDFDNGAIQLFKPNEDTLKKSQLTDIWNKANKK